MPRHQPFTALCRQVARLPTTGRADLHVHTTASDGLYTPAQVADLARRCGLAAVAITDHDTLDGIAPARAAARPSDLEVIAGVEITAEHRGRALDLLGYFIRLDDPPLQRVLKELQDHRWQRFRDMVARLRLCGVALEANEAALPAAPGRRHLAQLLIDSGRVGSVREAFQRYLGDRGRVIAPKLRLPVEKAIARVRGAGGVAAWAHPAYDGTRETLAELKALGLQAVEADYPGHRPSLVRELRRLAMELGLAVTGGSDCHGPGGRGVGTCSIDDGDLQRLRELAASVG